MIGQASRARKDHAETLEDMLLPTRPRRVLIAEDDEEMRRLLVAVMASDGCQVIEARDGLELSKFIGSQLLSSRDAIAVDLIISDVRMPGQSGLEVITALRQADWATPVILITAFGSEDVHREAHRLGAVATLDKPFEMEALRDLASRLISPGAARPSSTPTSVGRERNRRGHDR